MKSRWHEVGSESVRVANFQATRPVNTRTTSECKVKERAGYLYIRDSVRMINLILGVHFQRITQRQVCKPLTILIECQRTQRSNKRRVAKRIGNYRCQRIDYNLILIVYHHLF